jgi:catechol 2,3-dioxygenase-like lactoylglutathione lyase family enzyme
MQIKESAVELRNAKSVVKPYLLSHGTMECRSLKASRRFYEEFLGLECVRHGKISMLVRCGMKWHIVAVEVRNHLHPVHLLNHWGVEVRSKEEVDDAWREAHRLKESYGIRKIGKPGMQRGVYTFYLQDLDENWWEVAYSDTFRHDDYYRAGDRFGIEEEADGNAIAEAIEERDAADRAAPDGA